MEKIETLVAEQNMVFDDSGCPDVSNVRIDFHDRIGNETQDKISCLKKEVKSAETVIRKCENISSDEPLSKDIKNQVDTVKQRVTLKVKNMLLIFLFRVEMIVNS